MFSICDIIILILFVILIANILISLLDIVVVAEICYFCINVGQISVRGKAYFS